MIGVRAQMTTCAGCLLRVQTPLSGLQEADVMQLLARQLPLIEATFSMQACCGFTSSLGSHFVQYSVTFFGDEITE